MSVSFPNNAEIARQVKITKTQRELRKARSRFNRNEYHAALRAVLEAETHAQGIPEYEKEVSDLKSTINSAVAEKYAKHMAEAKSFIKQNKLKEAKAALEQAIAYQSTSEAIQRLRVVEDLLGTPDGMVYIPAGPCIMGDSTQEFWKREGPEHKVELPAYYIDMHPVTNAQYLEFVKATNYKMPEHWKDAGKKIPPGKEKHPVTHVSVADAQAYANWVKKRLPTEAEWEKAARGDSGLKYPWGNEYKPGMCNDESSKRGDTSPIGYFKKDKSPYGCHDMAGNVWEWTGTKFHLYPGSEADMEPGDDKLYIIKGGCFLDDKLYVRSSFRETVDPESAFACRATLGFRCVAAVKR
jgi:formylglycine-generating enzyme required for sulfatase activity